MKRIYLIATMVGLSLSATICCGQSSRIDGIESKLNAFIAKNMKALDVTGLSVALVVDGKEVVHRGYGHEDFEAGIPATRDTEYAVGSVSKLITGATVMKLHQAGLLDIDQPFRNYVPEFTMKKHFSGPIDFTPRHLLAHYAGLPRLHARNFLLKNPLPQQRILDYSEDNYLIAPAGYVYQYSDWGSDLLAVLVERVSGMPFEQYVKQEVLGPLEMTRSHYDPVGSKSYNKGKLTPTYRFGYLGSDGLTSTVEDLTKFAQMYINGGKAEEDQFFSKEIVQETFSPQFDTAPLNLNRTQGLMWNMRKFDGYTRISKGGIHEPFFSQVYIVPELELTLVICSNSNSDSRIHGRIYREVIREVLDSKGMSGETTKKKQRKVQLSLTEMARIEGIYNTDQGIVEMRRKGKKFKIHFSKEGTTVVGTPLEGHRIRLDYKLLGFIPIHIMNIFWEEIDDQIVVGEVHSDGYRSLGGVKMALTTIPESWKTAVGNYQLTNLSDDEHKTIDRVKLKMNDAGILEININVVYPRKFSLQSALKPMNESLARVPGYSFEFFAGETIRLEYRDGIPSLVVSGYVFEREQ